MDSGKIGFQSIKSNFEQKLSGASQKLKKLDKFSSSLNSLGTKFQQLENTEKFKEIKTNYLNTNIFKEFLDNTGDRAIKISKIMLNKSDSIIKHISSKLFLSKTIESSKNLINSDNEQIEISKGNAISRGSVEKIIRESKEKMSSLKEGVLEIENSISNRHLIIYSSNQALIADLPDEKNQGNFKTGTVAIPIINNSTGSPGKNQFISLYKSEEGHADLNSIEREKVANECVKELVDNNKSDPGAKFISVPENQTSISATEYEISQKANAYNGGTFDDILVNNVIEFKDEKGIKYRIPLTEDTKDLIIYQTSEAVRLLHKGNLAHCDLQRKNILVKVNINKNGDAQIEGGP